jgi:hypothetical protein
MNNWFRCAPWASNETFLQPLANPLRVTRNQTQLTTARRDESVLAVMDYYDTSEQKCWSSHRLLPNSSTRSWAWGLRNGFPGSSAFCAFAHSSGRHGRESQSNMRHQRRIQIPLPQRGRSAAPILRIVGSLRPRQTARSSTRGSPVCSAKFSKMLARKVDNECFKSPLDRDCSTHRQVDNTNRPLGVQPDRGCWSAVPDVSMLYINKIKHDEKCVVAGITTVRSRSR